MLRTWVQIAFDIIADREEKMGNFKSVGPMLLKSPRVEERKAATSKA